MLEYKTILQAVHEVRMEHKFRETNIATHAFAKRSCWHEESFCNPSQPTYGRIFYLDLDFFNTMTIRLVRNL